MPNNNVENVNTAKNEKNSPLPPQTLNDIIIELGDDDLQKAKANAPRWDIYHLAQIYVEGIKNGTRDAPNSIKAAFPVWCGKYTKGKVP